MISKARLSAITLLLMGSIFFILPQKVEAKECYLTNNYGICISDSEYNNLLNMGFYDFEIMNMNQEIYDANKNESGQVVSTETTYVKDTYRYVNGKTYVTTQNVTEEEYNNILPLCTNEKAKSGIVLMGVSGGVTETTGKKMTTTIIEQSNNLRYKVTLNWKNVPKVRSYDVIGVGLDKEKVYASGNRTFSQTYCVTAMSCSSSSTAKIKNQITGVGASFKLPSGNFVFMSSYLYYDVSKKNSGTTLKSLYAYGDYAHAVKTIDGTVADNNYAVGSGGINIYSTINSYYDEIPHADAHWTGNW